MKSDRLLRSLRLRVALFVGLATSAVAYYYADWTTDRSLRIKYKQIIYELRSTTYDLIGFLRANPAGVAMLHPTPPVTTAAAPTSDFDTQIFGTEKHLEKIHWAFFAPDHRFRGGNHKPPLAYLDYDYSQPSIMSGWDGRGSADAPVRDLPRSHDIAVDIVKPAPDLPRVMLARAHLPEGTLLLWFNLESAENNFGPKLMNRALSEILIYGTIAAAVSWWLVHLSLSPMRRIAQHAQRLSAKNLSERIALRSEPAEFDELTRVLNAMLDRLAESFRRVTGFSANASHELKTPLSVLQGELEIGLKHAPDNSEEQHRYLELLEEVYRLREITDTLLALAHSDQGDLVEHWAPFDLSETMDSVAEVVQQLDADLAYDVHIAAGITLTGDRRLIHQLIMNLGTNAARHNRPGGRVIMTLSTTAENAVVAVENTGQAIPQPEVKRIFDRFHRVDKARSRSTGGNGLGLNLASEIAKAHHGRLQLVVNEPDRIVFAVELPLRHPAPAAALA